MPGPRIPGSCMRFAPCRLGNQSARFRERDYRLPATEPFPVWLIDRNKFDDRFRPANVPNITGEPVGTIVVDTSGKVPPCRGKRRRGTPHGVAVGASGHAWQGTATIQRKAKWPAWYPTDGDMRKLRACPGVSSRARRTRSAQGPSVCTGDDGNGHAALGSTARRSRGPSAPGLVRLHPHVQRGRHRTLRPTRRSARG